MPTIILADCNAFRGGLTGVDDYVFARLRTGAVLRSAAEASNFYMTLVLAQRGVEDEGEADRLMQEIVRSRKPAESWLDPKQPLPLEAQAQRLIYEADLANGRKKQKLARRALNLWPDCADAYLFLAADSADADETLTLLQQGLEAGERALKVAFADDPDAAEALEPLLRDATLSEPLRDTEPLDEDEVEAAINEAPIEFWGNPMTRSYMRVRAELASVLRGVGRFDEALGHLRALLRLCPHDYQGNRYLLLGYLLQSLGRFSEVPLKEGKIADLLEVNTTLTEAEAMAEVNALLCRYAMDDSAHWQFTRAWWLFKSGETQSANAVLQEAFNVNRFFPVLVVGLERPGYDIERIIPGSPEEAYDYFFLSFAIWLDEKTQTWVTEMLGQVLRRYEAEHGLDLLEDDADELPPPPRHPFGKKRRFR